MFGWLKRLLRARDGSVLVMGALSLVSVLGMSGLAVEVGNAYNLKVQHQRIADVAALSAALAYKASPSGGLNLLNATAQDVAQANGLARSTATAQFPNNDTTKVQVTISTTMPLILTRAITNRLALSIANTAVASLPSSGSSACITALSGSVTYGVSITGGTTLTATGCAVASNSGISATAGTSLSAKQVAAGKSIYDQPTTWNGAPAITTTPSGGNIQQNLGNTAFTDTIGTDARVSAGLDKVSKIASNITLPTPNKDPDTPSGTNWAFPDPSAFAALPAGNPIKANCTLSGSTYNCNGGTYTIGSFTVPGNVSVTFIGSTTITIAGGIANNGKRITFVGGTLGVNGGVNTGSGGISFGDTNVTVGSGGFTLGSGGATFGNGDVKINSNFNASSGGISVTIGQGTHSFNGITVGGGCMLTLGAGDLNANGAISIAGGSTMTVGAGNVAIGHDSSGNAIYVGGGSHLTFHDGAFSANGSVITDGGSSITFGAATSHYINGTLNLNGSATFGAGAYYIAGDFTNNTGGIITGTDVTFFLTGGLTLSGGTSVNLSAPVSDSGGGVSDLLIATNSAKATKLGGGTKDVYAGLIYAPHSDMTMDGGAGAAGGGRCFSLMVNTFTMNGGTTAGTACNGVGGGASNGIVKLIQ